MKSLAMAAVFLLAGTGLANANQLTVFAASSLKEALDDIVMVFEPDCACSVDVAFAGSSTLARQIEFGAPADVFISANVDWMDHLDAKGLIAPATQRSIAGNTIVLVARTGDFAPVSVDHNLDLPTMLGGGRLALALTRAVPAGIYAKTALLHLGLWDDVSALAAETDNVRAALALVTLGAAPLGIVYATDATAQRGVDILGHFPTDSHPPITYPAAMVATSTHPQALPFLDFLASAQADEILKSYGFLNTPE